MIVGAMDDIANNSCITFCEQKEEEQAVIIQVTHLPSQF